MDDTLLTIDESLSSDEAQNQNEPKEQVPQGTSLTTESVCATGTKRKSDVWDHFDIIENSKPKRVACKYCNKSYDCESTNGTSTMRTHWQKRCRKAPHKTSEETQKTLSFKQTNHGNELHAVTYNYAVCRKALIEMIVLDELPFSFVEGEGFKRYSYALQPKFDPPGRFTVARDCIKLFMDEKKQLKKNLKGRRVCMITDTWTSIQNTSYMCLTAHYIDSEWKLQKRIVNFCQVPDHKGDTIGRMVEKCILDWGIGSVFTMTLDNASSNNVAIEYLKKKTKHLSGTILQHSYLHMRCAAHILNLIVSDGLTEVHDAIIKIRNAVRFVRSSPPRMAKFKNFAAIMKIECDKMVCLDVPTRWNSTYLMLDVATTYKDAFGRLEDDDLDYIHYFREERVNGKKLLGPPEASDWEAANVYLRFLKMFYQATLRVSGFSHVTSNGFFNELFRIETTLNKLITSNQHTLCSNAKKMKEKFNKYWSWEKINMLLYIALILDPRYKLEYIAFCFEELYGLDKAKDMEAKVKDEFVALYDFYLSLDGQSGTSLTSQSGNNPTRGKEVCGVDDVIVDMTSRFRKRMEQKSSLSSASEVDRYLQDRCENDDVTFDILAWWKVNSSKYRILSFVAADVLAIPVSSVASECAFSTGGRILDCFRSSLAPATVEALICTQDWLRAAMVAALEVEDEFERYERIERELLGSTSTITPVDVGN